MNKFSRKILVALAVSLTCVSPAFAYNMVNVTITNIDSPNQFGHLYVTVSAPSNCPNYPMPYFIIQGWGDQAEPALTNRKTMLSLVLTAFAAGKTISVGGASCYLDRYLFADAVTINN